MTPVSCSELPPSQINHEKNIQTVTQALELSSITVVSGSNSRFPIVVLDVDALNDTIAARLATSLLGHVLFLKNQIPLPVIQLARMPPTKNNPKAAKLKADLLSSYDTLASHLVTTFSALSTAFAKCASTESQATSRAYLAILIGPSLGTAKSKVIYAVNDFVTHIWGERDYDEQNSESEETPMDSEEEDNDESESEETSEGEEELETGGGPNSTQVTREEYDEDDHDEEEINPTSPPEMKTSYAEEQRFLQNADKLLSRLLASADSEGNGISNEMSPTQTHILVRAPRRFTHPSWIPRQNLTRHMDLMLEDFLNGTWDTDTPHLTKKLKPIEGVWVTARNGLGTKPQPDRSAISEDDEMIWWSWDGKFVGFADW